MKNIWALLILTVASVILYSCSSEEKVIDEFGDKRPVLLASFDGTSTKLSIYTFPTGTVSSDDEFAKVNGYTLSDSVSKIKEFRELLYLFIPKKYKVLVIDKQTFKPVDTLDFSSLKAVPSDICFANATDAYITLSTINQVCLYDLYNKKIARYINVGLGPDAIACSGNQIFVANYLGKSVSVVDSRYNTETLKIPVAAYPKFLGIRTTGKECIVVSLGEGKTGVETVKTAAQLNIIDVETKAIAKTMDLNFGSVVKAEETTPCGLTVGDKDGAIIPCDVYTLRVDLRTRTQFYSVGKYSYSAAVYDRFKDKVLGFTTDKAGAYKLAGLNAFTGASVNQMPIAKTYYLAFPL